MRAERDHRFETCLAPNNGTVFGMSRDTFCKAKVGLGIGLDTAGTVASFTEAGLLVQVGIGLASAANSAFNGNVGWTLANSTATQASAVGAGAKYAGLATTANALNKAGKFFSVVSLVHDVATASNDYKSCMEGN